MRSTIARGLLVTLVLASPLACAPAGPAADLSQEAPAPRREAGWVRFLNDGSSDVTLYFVADGVGYRLGNVARMENARFRLPHPHVRWYRVLLVAQSPGHTPTASIATVWEPGQNLAARMSRNYTEQNLDVWISR
ncbi:MAG TPA: hypothetical protein VF665_06830 [Longimicrobium sp.]|jgi:hypothetical protein|uniref:hypothetical protein n=1 Tax=Longimicrobium sp. TaxID=2029185 RepID=UPI002EDAB46F